MKTISVALYTQLEVTEKEELALSKGEIDLSDLLEEQLKNGLELGGEVMVCDDDSEAYETVGDLRTIIVKEQ